MIILDQMIEKRKKEHDLGELQSLRNAELSV
jgi:hypothetical protein